MQQERVAGIEARRSVLMMRPRRAASSGSRRSSEAIKASGLAARCWPWPRTPETARGGQDPGRQAGEGSTRWRTSSWRCSSRSSSCSRTYGEDHPAGALGPQADRVAPRFPEPPERAGGRRSWACGDDERRRTRWTRASASCRASFARTETQLQSLTDLLGRGTEGGAGADDLREPGRKLPRRHPADAGGRAMPS